MHTEQSTSVRRGRGTAAQTAQLRAAYLAAPRRCLQCEKPILPHEGEKIHETMRRTFCSRSCAASYNNGSAVAPKKKAKPRLCAECGTQVVAPAPDGPRLLCGSCEQEAWQRLPSLRRDAASGADLRRHVRHVLAERPRLCAHCGYSRHVEPVHLRPIDDFPPHATLATINAATNLAFLCPNHRWEFEHGIITLDPRIVAPTLTSIDNSPLRQPSPPWPPYPTAVASR